MEQVFLIILSCSFNFDSLEKSTISSPLESLHVLSSQHKFACDVFFFPTFLTLASKISALPFSLYFILHHLFGLVSIRMEASVSSSGWLGIICRLFCSTRLEPLEVSQCPCAYPGLGKLLSSKLLQSIPSPWLEAWIESGSLDSSTSLTSSDSFASSSNEFSFHCFKCCYFS